MAVTHRRSEGNDPELIRFLLYLRFCN